MHQSAVDAARQMQLCHRYRFEFLGSTSLQEHVGTFCFCGERRVGDGKNALKCQMASIDLTGCAVCVSGPCRKPGGAGGCLAYALCMLRCYSSPRKARAALDGAGEWVLAKRTSAETVHDPQSVFCKGETWCPEVIQSALQNRRFHISKVKVHREAQAVLQDKNVEGSFLVDGTQTGTRTCATSPARRHCM